jgi:hypothetical protein
VADPPRYPDTGDDPGVGLGRGSTTSTRRWVKVAGIIAIALVLLLFIILHLIAGLGPGLHSPGGDTPPSSVQQP